MADISLRNALRGINVLNPGVPEKEDAEVEVVFDDCVLTLSGKEAWEIVNLRNMGIMALQLAQQAGLQSGLSVDDIVVPFVIKKARQIWSLIATAGSAGKSASRLKI